MIFIVLITVIACIAVLAVSAAAFWSFLCAFAAVLLGQYTALVMNRRRTKAAPFSFWAVKFSLTFLMLVVSLRTLHDSGLLAAPYFVAGVVLAVLTNIVLVLRFAGGER